jgi:hypothetical protein
LANQHLAINILATSKKFRFSNDGSASAERTFTIATVTTTAFTAITTVTTIAAIITITAATSWAFIAGTRLSRLPRFPDFYNCYNAIFINGFARSDTFTGRATATTATSSRNLCAFIITGVNLARISVIEIYIAIALGA